MERYVVDITDDALADMEALYEHIAKKLQAPENAMGQYNRIADAILTLESFPDRYGLFECEPEHSLGIHKMVVDNYLVWDENIEPTGDVNDDKGVIYERNHGAQEY